jgi:hypothetical protein
LAAHIVANLGFQRDVSLWQGAGREPCIIVDLKSEACLALYRRQAINKGVGFTLRRKRSPYSCVIASL